jgi:hypothetical protein
MPGSPPSILPRRNRIWVRFYPAKKKKKNLIACRGLGRVAGPTWCCHSASGPCAIVQPLAANTHVELDVVTRAWEQKVPPCLLKGMAAAAARSSADTGGQRGAAAVGHGIAVYPPERVLASRPRASGRGVGAPLIYRPCQVGSGRCVSWTLPVHVHGGLGHACARRAVLPPFRSHSAVRTREAAVR